MFRRPTRTLLAKWGHRAARETPEQRKQDSRKPGAGGEGARAPTGALRLRSSVIETSARSLQILAPALIDLELTLLMYRPNLQLRRAHLALRRLGGLTKTRLCCAANPELGPGSQVCPWRCLRAGETHSANGINRPGAAYPYKRAFDTAAAGRPKDDETYYLGVRVELG